MPKRGRFWTSSKKKFIEKTPFFGGSNMSKIGCAISRCHEKLGKKWAKMGVFEIWGVENLEKKWLLVREKGRKVPENAKNRPKNYFTVPKIFGFFRLFRKNRKKCKKWPFFWLKNHKVKNVKKVRNHTNGRYAFLHFWPKKWILRTPPCN